MPVIGLCAALDLTRAGASVTIVEARDRPGGRVRTVRFDNGQHGELGGEFIDDDQEVLAAVRRACHSAFVADWEARADEDERAIGEAQESDGRT